MIRQTYGVLPMLALAAVVLAGCKTTPEVEPPKSQETTPFVKTTPPTPPPPPPRVDGEGNPVVIDQDGNVKPLGRTFYFEYDQARLAQGDIRILAMHADFLRDFRNRSVLVEGHCDERGTREYNLALGERRSEAVRRYLISAGVLSSQIESVSFGEERPVDPGHDDSAWSKNRRAVMIYR